MAHILVPIAEGFEELEAITIIDLLRRAGFDVVTAGLDEKPVRASRGNVIIPDTAIDKVTDQAFDLIVLPGGLPGADNLRDNPTLQGMLKQQHEKGKMLGAICAAPKALASAGVLSGKEITCYPGALNEVDSTDFEITGDSVRIDGNVITSRGPGTAMDFALTLIEKLGDKALRDSVEAGLVR
jgi:4-methyl-5(b-hydroxyethyl)-thiazole monophosphate biosynthesis